MQRKVKGRLKKADSPTSTTDITILRESMDGWVKDINAKFCEVDTMVCVLKENTGNIQHNYEMIQQLMQELEHMRHELETVKLVQLVTLNQHKTINKSPDMRT